MSEEELDKSVEDQKSINTGGSTQFALRTWQTWLEQSEFAEAEMKRIEVYTKQELSRLLKHFYCRGDTYSKRIRIRNVLSGKQFNEVLTAIYRKKMQDSSSFVTKSSPTLIKL